jgi:hypothetical protein
MANSSQDPISKIKSKMDWRCGSSSVVPALQVRNSEFKSQSHPNPPKKHLFWQTDPQLSIIQSAQSSHGVDTITPGKLKHREAE